MSDYFFYRNGSLVDFLKNLSDNAIGEVNQLDPDYLLNASEGDLIEALYSKHEQVCPSLLTDEVYIFDQTECIGHRIDYGQLIKIPGMRVTIAVPYTGDSKFFHFKPSTNYVRSKPQGYIKGDEIHLYYFSASDEGDALKNNYEKDLKEITDYLGWASNDIEKSNSSLRDILSRAVTDRKTRLLRDRNTVASLGLPIKRRADKETTFSVPDLRRKPTVRMPKVTEKAFEPEPVFSEKEYDYVLNVIQDMVLVMERSPNTFSRMDEESLRDHILVQLNGHYEGQATGETFNATGKTDILIRYNGQNVFIAECKMWRGSKALIEALDQLLGYTSWRDTKTALIIFNRNKNHSNVIESIKKSVPNHPSFKKTLKERGESEFRYLFGQPDDLNRELYLTIQVFHVPKEYSD